MAMFNAETETMDRRERLDLQNERLGILLTMLTPMSDFTVTSWMRPG